MINFTELLDSIVFMLLHPFSYKQTPLIHLRISFFSSWNLNKHKTPSSSIRLHLKGDFELLLTSIQNRIRKEAACFPAEGFGWKKENIISIQNRNWSTVIGLSISISPFIDTKIDLKDRLMNYHRKTGFQWTSDSLCPIFKYFLLKPLCEPLILLFFGI